jgi:hypothetical protein
VARRLATERATDATAASDLFCMRPGTGCGYGRCRGAHRGGGHGELASGSGRVHCRAGSRRWREAIEGGERGSDARVHLLDLMVVLGCTNLKYWKFQCLPTFREIYRIFQRRIPPVFLEGRFWS